MSVKVSVQRFAITISIITYKACVSSSFIISESIFLTSWPNFGKGVKRGPSDNSFILKHPNLGLRHSLKKGLQDPSLNICKSDFCKRARLAQVDPCELRLVNLA